MLFMVCRPDMNALWYLIIGLCHPIRSLVGRYIAHQIPCSQTLLDEANIKDGAPQTYAKLKQVVPFLFRELVICAYKGIQKELVIYNILTALCVVFDVVAMVVFLVRLEFNAKTSACAHSIQLGIVCLFGILNMAFGAQCLRWCLKLPCEMRRPFLMAASIGHADSLIESLRKG